MSWFTYTNYKNNIYDKDRIIVILIVELIIKLLSLMFQLRPWASGYGDTNWFFYTKSHCDCDTDFFNCLVAADNEEADKVGNLYFNTMKVQCLRENPGLDLCPPPK